MTKKKLKGKGDEEAHGILEGISSLHSWIKTQTMIRPTKLGKKREDSFDDVSDANKLCHDSDNDNDDLRMMTRMWSSPFAQRILRPAKELSDLTTPRGSTSL